MKRTPTVIISIACVLAMNSCAKPPKESTEQIARPIAEMRKAVETNVTEPGRQGQMLSVVDELDDFLEEHATDLEAISSDLRRLNTDYDVPRESIEKVLSEFASRTKARKQRLLDLHFQLTGLTSPEEWQSISKHETEVLGAARSYIAK